MHRALLAALTEGSHVEPARREQIMPCKVVSVLEHAWQKCV